MSILDDRDLDRRGKTQYVLGFAFRASGEVLLIRKARPEWQRGKLNGVGGHVEEGEDGPDAMIREFEEETGIVQRVWLEFATMTGPDWECRCFAARVPSNALQGGQYFHNGETVGWYTRTGMANSNPLSNVPWLAEMAIDALCHQGPVYSVSAVFPESGP